MPNAVGPQDAGKLRNSPFSAARLAIEELHGEELHEELKVRAIPAFYRLLHSFVSADTLRDHIS